MRSHDTKLNQEVHALVGNLMKAGPSAGRYRGRGPLMPRAINKTVETSPPRPTGIVIPPASSNIGLPRAIDQSASRLKLVRRLNCAKTQPVCIEKF